MLHLEHSTASFQCPSVCYQNLFVMCGYTFKLGQQVGVNVGPTHQAGSRRGIKDFVSSFCDSFGSITHIEPWNDTQVLDKVENGRPGCSIFMGRKNCTWGKEPSSWWWCSCNLCKQRLKLNHFVQIHTISKHTQHLQEMCNCYLLKGGCSTKWYSTKK